MKKLILSLLLILPAMFTACSDDDDNGKNNNGEGNKKSTSFVVTNTNEGAKYKSAVAGYFDKGKCKKIADLGDLEYNKPSAEIKVIDAKVTEVFIFYLRSDKGSYKISPGFKLEGNKKKRV